MKKLVLISVCALLASVYVYGKEDMFFKGLEAGAIPEITDLIFDQDGYMWFSTYGGLFRFDGYRSKGYTLAHLDIADSYMDRVDQDGKGNIWVRSRCGVYVFDRESERLCDSKDSILISYGINDDVYKVMIDDYSNVWAVSDNAIHHYDCKKNKLLSAKVPEQNEVLDICTRNRESFILFSNGDVYRMNLATRNMSFEVTVSLSDYSWHYLYVDTEYNIWFYTAHSSKDKLKVWSCMNQEWLDLHALDELDDVIVNTLIDDGRGRIWIGTSDEGIFVYDDEELRQYLDDGSRYSIPCNHITRLVCDDFDRIWVMTTVEEGVAYYDLGEPAFSRVAMGDNKYVSSVDKDRQGNLWVGFGEGGVSCIRPDGTAVHFNKENDKLSTNIVISIHVDRKGRVWAGTFGDGPLYLEDGVFRKPDIDIEESKKAYIDEIEEDHMGTIWFGTIDNGLIGLRMNGEIVNLNCDNSDIKSNSITSLFADDEGFLYVGTSVGLDVYDIEKNEFCSPGKFAAVDGVSVNNILCSAEDILWVGTDKGLMAYDRTSDELFGVTGENVSVFSILEDSDACIWAGSDIGLIRVRHFPDKEGEGRFVCERYCDESGLESVRFMDSASYCSADGTCLIGAVDGIVRINHLNVRDMHKSGKVMFTSLGINGEFQDVDSLLVLDHKQNTFSIDVALMDISQLHKVDYEYRLSEEGTGWVKCHGNTIPFYSLPYGKYTIQVRATDNVGWTSDMSSLAVYIKPPYWRTTYAYLSYVLLASALIWFIFLRLNKRHKEQMNIQRLEDELAYQIELDKTKTQFFTNINHDIRTPLSLIILPLEKMLKENIPAPYDEDVRLSLRNARFLMHEINEYLDVRKIVLGVEHANMTYGDVVPFLHEVVVSFNEYVHQSGITLQFQSDAEIYMDHDKVKLRRILSNLITNAVKYNNEGGTVDVHVRHGNGTLVVEVSDTGIGVPDEEKERIFDRFYQCDRKGGYTGSGVGLHIVMEYVKLLRGSVSVRNNDPHGSVFEILIPITDNYRNDAVCECLEYEMENKSADVISDKILIVDDNKSFRGFMEKYLGNTYDVVTASNGAEALEVLKKYDVMLIISDVMMPEVNGLELCKAVKSDIMYSHIPIILLTAKSSEEDFVAGLKSGADDYIKKPFSLEALELKVSKMLEWSRANRKKIVKGANVEPSEITVSSLDQRLIEKAIRIIEENLDNSEFSVEDLSSAIGLTRGHLYKKFMFIMGMSPLSFIHTIRIKRGMALLEQGWSNISEIAYSVGFSPKQFSKKFKEMYGVLPSEYLKNKEV